MKTTLEWAKWYVSKGFSVIPIKHKGKEPAIFSWKGYQDKLPTNEELVEWFGNNSKNNIAIVTGKISNIVAIDLDSEKAIKFAERNNFPDSPTSKTGKGSHIVYRYKDGVRNFQKREDLPDIDLRGDGGYILVEPSIHPSGHQYQWVKGKGLDDLPLAELPEIILAKSPEQKTPLRELYQGVPQGSRNDSLTRLAGSWARDGLSFEECLESAYLWNSKNAPPLSGREIECTVRSIYQKHHQENKTTDKQPMVLIPLGDLLKGEEEERVWLVDEIMLLGGFVGIGAKPKVGKSTLMRQLALNIAGGEPFLGKEVISGPVIYLALEDKLSEVKRHFRAMGARGHEKIYIYADAIPANVISQVKDAIENIRPVLLIIDPLFKFTKVKDTSAYAETLGALDSVLRLARKHEVTVSFTHHGTKADREGIDSFLGSIAIVGSVDTAMIMKRYENYRTLQIIQRYGEDLEETTLMFDKETGVTSIGKAKLDEDINSVKDVIYEYLKSQEEPTTEEMINNNVEGRTILKRKALRQLVSEGKVKREGKGGKGDPFKYSCSLVPNIYREQENENHESDLKPSTDAKNTCSQNFAENEKNDKLREQAFKEVIDLEHEELEIIE